MLPALAAKSPACAQRGAELDCNRGAALPIPTLRHAAPESHTSARSMSNVRELAADTSTSPMPNPSSCQACRARSRRTRSISRRFALGSELAASAAISRGGAPVDVDSASRGIHGACAERAPSSARCPLGAPKKPRRTRLGLTMLRLRHAETTTKNTALAPGPPVVRRRLSVHEALGNESGSFRPMFFVAPARRSARPKEPAASKRLMCPYSPSGIVCAELQDTSASFSSSPK